LTLTLDSSCVNAKQRDPDLNQLEAWAVEGLVRLLRTEALDEEVRPGSLQEPKARTVPTPPPPFILDASVLGGGDALKGEWLAEEVFRKVLFPSTAPAALTPSQWKDIRHLQLHVYHGGDCFVTGNPNDFIRQGKQDVLRRLGIWAFTPDGMVAHVRAITGRRA
jgi:hypothetical protein